MRANTKTRTAQPFLRNAEVLITTEPEPGVVVAASEVAIAPPFPFAARLLV